MENFCGESKLLAPCPFPIQLHQAEWQSESRQVNYEPHWNLFLAVSTNWLKIGLWFNIREYIPPLNAVVASLPIYDLIAAGPPGWIIMNDSTLYMNPATQSSGRPYSTDFWNSSQVIRGICDGGVPQSSVDRIVSSRFLRCWYSDLCIWFRENLLRLVTSPNFSQVQMNHFVGSYWFHLIPLR